MSATAMQSACRAQRPAAQPARALACSTSSPAARREPRCVVARGKGNPFRPVVVHDKKPKDPDAPFAHGRYEKAAPAGKALYETLIVLKPTMGDDERDLELARFESFLLKQDCTDVVAMVRGRHHMAYPIKGHWEGIYVLFSYISRPAVIPGVQKLLSEGRSGQEDDILRHMTFRY